MIMATPGRRDAGPRPALPSVNSAHVNPSMHAELVSLKTLLETGEPLPA